MGGLFGPTPLQAQTSDPVPVPPVATDPLLTLLIGAAYTAVSLLAMFFVKKWLFPTSNAYTFAMSFTILLLLGAITQTIWADLIGVALAQGSP
jgi:hypothetical protein